MRTLLTGQQGTPALCPANRAFFFWRESIFFKKIIKNFIFSLFFLLSLSLSLFYTLWVLLSLMNFTEVRCEGKLKKVLHTNYRSIRASRLSTDQVGLSNNNPHWNLGFRFLFFPDLIQVLRDLKVTHPSLERLESDSK